MPRMMADAAQVAGSEGGAARRQALHEFRGWVLRAIRLVLPGLVVGAMAAAALSRLISGLLYGVEAIDAETFIAVPLGLLAVAILAAQFPARRAALATAVHRPEVARSTAR